MSDASPIAAMKLAHSAPRLPTPYCAFRRTADIERRYIACVPWRLLGPTLRLLATVRNSARARAARCEAVIYNKPWSCAVYREWSPRVFRARSRQ